MADKGETIEIQAHDDHIDTLTDVRAKCAKLCGTSKSESGHDVPDTTNEQVSDLARWFHKEYARVTIARPWLSDPAQKQWERDAKRIGARIKNADPNALFSHNNWFWNQALLKLAIFLQSQKSKPSPLSLFVESLDESVDDRIKQARDFVEEAGEVASDAISAVGKAAEAVSNAGERAWSGIKTVAIIGGGLVGAAIVLPPLIRAMRD